MEETPLGNAGALIRYRDKLGTPERFAQVSRDFACGTVKAKNLSKPQKAIFLDRDGTINRHIGFLRKPEELELLPGAAEDPIPPEEIAEIMHWVVYIRINSKT